MSWSARRKATYFLSFLFATIILLLIILAPLFNRPASCSDGVQNQGELGIDCGGPCTHLCRASYADPSILWVRWAKVLSSGAYNFLAYGQNPNANVGAYDVPYSYKIYDKSGILLYENSGSAYIPPLHNFVVFDDAINIGDKIPARVDFQFSTSSIIWQNIAGKENSIETVSKELANTDTRPKLFAVLKNVSISPINNIQSFAILYDQNGNAIAFSKTLIDSIDAGSANTAVFTWPEPFPSPVYKIDILSEVVQK